MYITLEIRNNEKIIQNLFMFYWTLLNFILLTHLWHSYENQYKNIIVFDILKNELLSSKHIVDYFVTNSNDFKLIKWYLWGNMMENFGLPSRGLGGHEFNFS